MKNRAAFTLVVTAATLSVTACGGESKPKPMDAVTKMQARLKTYKTLDFTVTGTRDGQPTTMKIHGPSSGSSMVSDVTENGNTGHAVFVNNAIYLKADGDSLKKDGASDATSQLFAGKWLKKNAALSGQDNLMKSILDPMIAANPTGKAGSLSGSDTVVTSDKVNGHDAWKLTASDKKHIMWVQKDSFDLLKFQGMTTGGDIDSPTLTINNHDEPEDIKAPAGAVDLSQLGK